MKSSDAGTQRFAEVAQRFAESEPEMLFTDPDRRKKIESAFSSIGALVDEDARRMLGCDRGALFDGGCRLSHRLRRYRGAPLVGGAVRPLLGGVEGHLRPPKLEI